MKTRDDVPPVRRPAELLLAAEIRLRTRPWRADGGEFPDYPLGEDLVPVRFLERVGRFRPIPAGRLPRIGAER
ncbi:MAG: hypothetical protein Q8W51_12195 [Candidatus Palauibacterales bacterium]|nr:hypothetical protein [Candidatus Palauibacterales bacterium]MDP2530480.1 hypothetical protein [Candidatus Palauibacterales bacterium]MDP2582961.1 hypothetical protein [Candidatus Palauibacterales bacterium]